MTIDPTSGLGEDTTEANAPRCVNCSEPIVNEPTHRVVTRIENDSVHTEHFCGVACLTKTR